MIIKNYLTSKIIKKRLTGLYAHDNILYINGDSGDIIFSCNEILSVDLNIIDFDRTNYDEDDPETITHVSLLTWHIKFEKRNALKNDINKE